MPKEIISYWLYNFTDRWVGMVLCLLLSPLAKILPKKSSKNNKILAIKLSMMGDTILLIPALRALRGNFNDAHIAILCSKINIEILRHCPYLDETIVVDFKRFANPVYLLKVLFQIKKRNFDIAIDFEQWYRITPLLAFFSFAPKRIGFKTSKQYRHYLFTQSVYHVEERHEIECFFDLLGPLRIEAKLKNLELWPTKDNAKQAGRILDSLRLHTGFVVLHAELTATARQRQWPIEYFAAVGSALIEKHNQKLIIACTGKGKEEAERLNALLGGKAAVIVDVPLLSLYVLLAQAKFVLCNNTGFMHLAAASATRVVAIQGPVSNTKWGPWGGNHIAITSPAPCSPCVYLGNFEFGCKMNKCMQQIKPQEVLRRIEEANLI